MPGYPVPTFTTGLRNLTGVVNPNETVTIYAITSQFSSISIGEPDPDRLVGITDSLAATTLPAGESFVTLQSSGAGEVFRGVAIAPCGFQGVAIKGVAERRGRRLHRGLSADTRRRRIPREPEFTHPGGGCASSLRPVPVSGLSHVAVRVPILLT
jgi:hypothetical protein